MGNRFISKNAHFCYVATKKDPSSYFDLCRLKLKTNQSKFANKFLSEIVLNCNNKRI